MASFLVICDLKKKPHREASHKYSKGPRAGIPHCVNPLKVYENHHNKLLYITRGQQRFKQIMLHAEGCPWLPEHSEQIIEPVPDEIDGCMVISCNRCVKAGRLTKGIIDGNS